MNSCGDFALQYAVERWLLRPDEGYFITDLAKCAMGVATARALGTKCYELCAPFLRRELALFQPKAVIGIGRKSGRWLKSRAMTLPVFEISHYSAAGKAHWPKVQPITEMLSLDDFQAFIDGRWTDVPNRRSRPIRAHPSDMRLLAVYRQQLTEIRGRVHGDGARR